MINPDYLEKLYDYSIINKIPPTAETGAAAIPSPDEPDGFKIYPVLFTIGPLPANTYARRQEHFEESKVCHGTPLPPNTYARSGCDSRKWPKATFENTDNSH
jgi:hypothetical protein